MARRKAPGTDIANIQKQIAEQAKRTVEATGSGGGMTIRVNKMKQFISPDGTKVPGPIQVVIVDFNAGNRFWDTPYKEGESTPPACFSIGQPGSLGGEGAHPDKLIPSPNSPRIQSDACITCAMNEYDSHPSGRGGKACSNRRFYELITNLDPDADQSSTPMYSLSCSPTALSGWDGYVKTLAAGDRAPVSVITEISFDPENDSPVLQFRPVGENPFLGQHYARQEEARLNLATEPDLTGGNEVAAPKRTTKKRAAKKKTASRRRTA